MELTLNGLSRLNNWQHAVFQEIAHGGRKYDNFRPMYSPEGFNKEFGVKINMGRRSGHSTLAAAILHEIPSSVVIVAHEAMKSSVRSEGRLWRLCDEDDTRRLYNPAQFLKRGGWMRDAENSVCVVDNASCIKPDVLEKIRSFPWNRYVELG